MKFSYFPGCSLHSTAKEYDESTRAVCKALEVELLELPDWNCCGATSAHSLNHLLALSLPARNLKLAQQLGLDLVLPCAACFNRMKELNYVLREDEKRRTEIEELLNFTYSGNVNSIRGKASTGVKIIHLLDLIVNIIGLEKIRSRVISPLGGLRLVCYYGCLLVRPATITEFDDPENPAMLDRLITTLGADSLDWSYKTECCGASLSLTRRDVVINLVGRLIDMAREAGAEGIVTACPLCQANLEMRQGKGFPIFYFTELLGIALGLEEARQWLDRHLVSVKI